MIRGEFFYAGECFWGLHCGPQTQEKYSASGGQTNCLVNLILILLLLERNFF